MSNTDKNKKSVMASLRELISDSSPVYIREKRAVEDGKTRLDLACGEERRVIESESKDVAHFTLAQFLAEEDLISKLMKLPECDRRRRIREEEWKRSKKPCPNECDKGRIQAMDGWMRCQVCNGNGWVT